MLYRYINTKMVYNSKYLKKIYVLYYWIEFIQSRTPVYILWVFFVTFISIEITFYSL